MKKIIILDFGGQYAHLIGTRLRKLGTFSEIYEPEASLGILKTAQGIIFSGGPQSVYDPNSPTVNPQIFKLGVPILGICYGHQLMNHLLGGKVFAGKIKEYGTAKLNKVNTTPLFQGVRFPTTVWMSHGDEVIKLAPGFMPVAFSGDCKNAAVADAKRHFYGVQFHPEVVHTLQGTQILANFLQICGVKNTWSMENFLETEIAKIKKQVENKRVFMLVSGGVDSTVAFALLEKALGKNKVYGLFVDTGLMRYQERRQVEKALKKLGLDNLHIAERSVDFLEALKDKVNPEEKRKIIGALFLKIQQEVAQKLKLNPNEWLLGQGTIYPDTIETGGTKNADKIKTHHNRVPEIQILIKQGKVIEPLKELYKDEVRELGEKLGLPHSLVWRHPFPGPGLGVRILCSARAEKLSAELKQTEKELNRYLKKIEQS